MDTEIKGELHVDFQRDTAELYVSDFTFKELVEHFKTNVLHVVLRTKSERGDATSEQIIANDITLCPVCGTDEWASIRCPCHRVCKNGHMFRRKGW